MPGSASLDLFLLRHGIAEERVAGRDDPERALTPSGRQRTLAVVRRLRSLGFTADRLLSSPFRRARETAELALQVGLASELQLESRLMPGGDCDALLPSLEGRCLLVGHEPDLSAFAARLLGAPDQSIRLRKAGFCHLHIPAGPAEARSGAQLEALLRPRFLLPRSV